jgi:2-desacetyl-2-hydroxyethyl bacteriochlorophyllide A dehydrogenase
MIIFMKAIVWTKYGPPDVLEYREVAKPVPRDKEILIRIHAATVTAGDCEMRRFDLPAWIWIPARLYMGLIKPRINILGQELAGEVVSVGKDVNQFRKGDKIFAETGMGLGAYAEYTSLSSTCVMANKPANMSYEEAATITTGGLNALHFLKSGNIGNGKKVLINGAGGSIGTYAVQIAKSIGANVTCVDSTGKLDMLRSLGSDRVIDYTEEDFTQNGETYDIIIDVVGKTSFSRCVRSLSRNGYYILGNPRFAGMIRGLWISTATGKKVISKLARYKTEDMVFLRELIEAGKIKSIIDRKYPLEQVAEAHRYVETGQKTGNVVIMIS